jgi:hypothetical protein
LGSNYKSLTSSACEAFVFHENLSGKERKQAEVNAMRHVLGVRGGGQVRRVDSYAEEGSMGVTDINANLKSIPRQKEAKPWRLT